MPLLLLYALPFATSAGLLVLRLGPRSDLWLGLGLALLIVGATFVGFLRLAQQDQWRHLRILGAGVVLHLPCLVPLLATLVLPRWLAASLLVLVAIAALWQCLSLLATIGAAGRSSSAAFSVWIVNVALGIAALFIP